MARKPNKKPPRRKPPSVNQRLRAQAKSAAAQGRSSVGQIPNRHLPDVRLDKAQKAWDAGCHDEAIWYYERALARDPNNPVLLADVARAYALRYRYADAEKLVERAESLHSKDAHLQEMLARSFTQIQQFDRAIACYRRSLELAPSSPERPQILLELAKMHERLHDLAAARTCVEEALVLAPNLEAARYMLANIERRDDNIEIAETLYREIIAAKKASLRVTADSWYQLAAIHDKAGQYEQAFHDLTLAKKIFMRGAAHYFDDAWTIARNAGKTFAAISQEQLDRWNMAGRDLEKLDGRLSLLTSHPRSGTTLLEQVLDSHPGAISADELQIMVELVNSPLGRTAGPNESAPSVFDRTSLEDLNRLRGDYWLGIEGALRQPIAGRLLVDKNPEMTYLLPLVARVFPEMKIVFALRDPRDVVVSCFMQQLPLNATSVNYLSLEGTAKKYAASMRAWLKIRGMLRNPWIEIRYEDMVADLEGQARKVLDFLELPWDEQVLEYHRRAQRKHVHSPTYESVTKPIYTSSVARWRNYATQLEPYREILQPYVEAFEYA
jgi:tetratricopeptide (TPR) repeat protein